NESCVSFCFGNDELKLFGRNGTCSILNDHKFIAEEIEIFRINNTLKEGPTVLNAKQFGLTYLLSNWPFTYNP
ncbi:1833_t:CDS:2, partial [Dentiscutata erythropus]